MNGQSMNQKFLGENSKERKGDEQHYLINIGSCGFTRFMVLLKPVPKMPNGI